MLPDLNSNKVPLSLRCIILHFQPFERARDLCKGVPDSVIKSEDGAEAIVKAIYKRDALTVVSEVYQNFVAVFDTTRDWTETFKSFESLFDAQLPKFNASSPTTKLPHALTELMLLANSALDSSQRVCLNAAASPTDGTISENATTDQFLDTVSYSTVVSLLGQCEQTRSSDTESSSTKIFALRATTGDKNVFNSTMKGKQRLTPELLADFKRKSKCRERQKFGHWKSDHNSDGSPKPGTKSSSESS